MDMSSGESLAPFTHVVDILGDGTFGALSTPGYTPDHLAYLINTAPTPVFIAGDAELTTWAMEHKKEEIFELAKRIKVPIGPLYSMEEVVNNPHLKERDFFIGIEHPETGKLLYPGAPYILSKTPWEIRMPAPKLGQHNLDIYCDQLGYTREELVKLYEVGII